MKDIYKNPVFYYILVPVLIGLWPLMLRTVYIPETESTYKDEIEQFEEGQQLIDKILKLDPGRLEQGQTGEKGGQFDYDNAVDKIASLYSISYTSSSKPARKATGGQKTKNAAVNLDNVDIASFAKFLSTIQIRWAKLQCENVTLKKNKGLPDKWDILINFKYYY